MTSTKLQTQCAKWFRAQYPRLIINASTPDAGKHSDWTGQSLVDRGYCVGFPDLFVYHSKQMHINKEDILYLKTFHGLCFECKREDEKLTLLDGTAATGHIWDQYQMMVKLRDAGYPGCFIQTLDEFMLHVRNYIEKGIAPELQMILPMSSAKEFKYKNRRSLKNEKENRIACELFKTGIINYLLNDEN